MSIEHMQMVFDAGDLTSAEKSILLAYCNFTDPHGYCWPGVDRISDMTGISVRTIKRTRATLAERGLIASKRRLTAAGHSITSITRVNLSRLAELKRPRREYDDSIAEEIGFTPPDQPTCHGDTPLNSEGVTMAPGWGHSGPAGGATMARNPSVDPSDNPSSSGVAEVRTKPAFDPAPKKRSPEQIIAERLAHTPDGAPTPEEARAVVTLIEAQAAAAGTRIRSISAWVAGRGERDLLRDLGTVRRRKRPTGATCGLHHTMMVGGECSSCMGDVKAGDAAEVRRHLDAVGAGARPDLAAVFGAPQVVPSQDMEAYWKQIRRPRGGAAAPIPSAEDWESGRAVLNI